MKQLSKKDIKNLSDKLAKYGINISPKDKVYETDDCVLVENKPLVIKVNDNYYPSLKFDTVKLPSVFVDKGAIPFVVKGADLMRPGVKSFETYLVNDIVAIRDAEHKKVIALGIALFDSSVAQTMTTGKVVKTYHYVGDKYWNSIKS